MGRVQAYFIAAQRSEINLFAGLEVMGKRGTAINVVGSATVTGKFELGGEFQLVGNQMKIVS